ERTTATAAKPKKTNKIKPAAVGDANSVRQWKECRTAARPGHAIKPKESYDKAYVPWCQEQAITPVSFTKYGIIMKNELGVEYVERNKRGFYLDIALVGGPLKVVAGNAA